MNFVNNKNFASTCSCVTELFDANQNHETTSFMHKTHTMKTTGTHILFILIFGKLIIPYLKNNKREVTLASREKHLSYNNNTLKQ